MTLVYVVTMKPVWYLERSLYNGRRGEVILQHVLRWRGEIDLKTQGIIYIHGSQLYGLKKNHKSIAKHFTDPLGRAMLNLVEFLRRQNTKYGGSSLSDLLTWSLKER